MQSSSIVTILIPDLEFYATCIPQGKYKGKRSITTKQQSIHENFEGKQKSLLASPIMNQALISFHMHQLNYQRLQTCYRTLERCIMVLIGRIEKFRCIILHTRHKQVGSNTQVRGQGNETWPESKDQAKQILHMELIQWSITISFFGIQSHLIQILVNCCFNQLAVLASYENQDQQNSWMGSIGTKKDTFSIEVRITQKTKQGITNTTQHGGQAASNNYLAPTALQ